MRFRRVGRLMDDQLRIDLLRLLSSLKAQLESGKPLPPYLRSPEFIATLAHHCERLEKAPTPVENQNTPSINPPLHLIVSAGSTSGETAFRNLRGWLKGSSEIIICDPYLLKYRKSDSFKTIDAYVNAINGMIPRTAKKIEIYTNSYETEVKKKLSLLLKDGREVKYINSKEIHDRFIIKGEREGKIIGTSFGGFGNKFFAVLDLSEDDAFQVKTLLRNLRLNQS
jgi:hypothetical protein